MSSGLESKLGGTSSAVGASSFTNSAASASATPSPSSSSSSVASGISQTWLAMSRFRRRKFESAISICTKELESNPRDEAVWFLKARALTQNVFIDDLDIEEENVADILLDDSAMAKAPRPGTSLRRPLTGAQSGGGLLRPTSHSGRPVTGFARPGTQSGRGVSRGGDADAAFKGVRPGSSRPMSVAGRFVRLATASLLNAGGPGQFIDLARINIDSFVKRPALAKALMDYALYHEHNPKRALEIGAKATEAAKFEDWWWKARLGKAYYQLGLYREAEQQFRSALKQQDMAIVQLELTKIFYKLDQPNAALNIYNAGLASFRDPQFAVGAARIYEALGDLTRSLATYKHVLTLDQSNIEAVSCLAAHYFYSDQPELALRFYRRLLQMNVNNTQVWNNVGLCCFYASQFDMALGCFDRALMLAEDDEASDIWYNVSQVAIGLGDLVCCFQYPLSYFSACLPCWNGSFASYVACVQ